MNKEIIWFTLLILLSINNSCTYRHITRTYDNKIIPEPPPPPPNPDDTIAYKEYINGFNCKYENKFSPKDRRLIFPFNKAKSIQIVSFLPVVDYLTDSTFIQTGGLPHHGKRIDFSKFLETITLNENQIDSLTDILYNYRFITQYTEEGHLTCFCESENAILFLDKHNKCFAYLELCFEGPDFDYYPHAIEMDLGHFCKQKLALLKAFLKNTGIKNGLD